MTNARPGTVAVQALGDDDPAHGTGMTVLLKRRQDGRFDIYRPPGLALDPEHAQVGGDLGAWVEADIDPARFDISHDGVDVDVGFAPLDGHGDPRERADAAVALGAEGRPARPVVPAAHRMTRSEVGIDLYWLPLGAGGWFVRLNGRIYEAVNALAERRRPLDLYHSALEVRVPEGRFVIENCWPIPDGDGAGRGVAVDGPVLSRRLARRRMFRYEVRRWRDGVIVDADEAVASPQRLSDDPLLAHRLLELVGDLPSPVWGRDELGTGEMWNSNSVIAWLLARSGLPMDEVRPPAGGRAPGWEAGLVVSRRQQRSDRRGGCGARDADSAGRQLRVRAG